MDTEALIVPKIDSQLLVMNAWRYDLPEAQRNIIIAHALNACVKDKAFHITGYLITNRRLFFMGLSISTPFEEVLNYFYYCVETGIVSYKKRNNEYDNNYHLAHYSQHKLFETFPFYNYHIRSIITSKKVNLSYHDTNLARLKAYIKNHNYCSVLDYAGGKSPVIVNTDYIIN